MDGCDKLKGCVHTGVAGACDDGNACTEGDGCQGTVCVGKAVACNDDSVCTKDACVAGKGCVFTTDPTACDDGNVCTTDSCSKAAGCAHANNTLPCEVGDACTEGDTCSGGACVAGALPALYSIEALKGENIVGHPKYAGYAVAAVADGGSCVVGRKYNVIGGNQYAGYPIVLRSGPGGNKLWVADIPSGPFDYLDEILVAGNGWLLVGDVQSTGAGGYDGWVVRIDGAGNVLWSYSYGGPAGDVLRAVAPMGQDFLLAGYTASKGAGSNDGWLVRISGDGVVKMDATVGGAGNDALYGLVALKDGGYVAAGSTTTWGGGDSDGWLVRLDAAGKVLWQHSYGKADPQWFDDVVELDDGSVVAGGAHKPPGLQYATLVGVDPSGRAQWSKIVSPGNGALSAKRLAAVPGGVAVVDTDPWVKRFDRRGNLLWQGGYKPIDIAAVPGDKLVAVGANDISIQLLRIDAWGNTDCIQAGVCAAKTRSACDDGNPCTGTKCAATSGCGSALNTAPCTSAVSTCSVDDTCSSGKCLVGKPRLWDVAPLGSALTDRWSAVVTSTLGGLVVAGFREATANSADWDGWLARIDGTGQPVWEKIQATGDKFAIARYEDVAEFPDGRIAVGGGLGTAAATWAGLRVFDPDGNALFDWVNPAGSTTSANFGYYYSAVAVASDADVLAAGYFGGKSMVSRLSDQLSQERWTLTLGADLYVAYDIAERPDGQIDVWGAGGSGSVLKGAAHASVSASGKLIGIAKFSLPGTESGLVSASPAPGGGAFVAAPAKIAGTWRTVILRVDASDNVVWQRLVDGTEPRYPFDLTLAASTLVVGGMIGSETNGWLAGFALDGSTLWQRSIGGSAADNFTAVTVLEDNLVAVGATASKGKGLGDGWLVRTDAWGQGPCSASGPCVKLAPTACADDKPCTIDTCSAVDGCVQPQSSCNDDNPCTTDACAPATGCTWTPVEDGSACGGVKKCSAGWCGP